MDGSPDLLTRFLPAIESWDLAALLVELDVVLDLWESGDGRLPGCLDDLERAACRALGCDWRHADVRAAEYIGSGTMVPGWAVEALGLPHSRTWTADRVRVYLCEGFRATGASHGSQSAADLLVLRLRWCLLCHSGRFGE